MKKYEFFIICLLAASLNFGMSALAEETTLEKAETVTSKATDSVKRTYRHAKDKACEMVNGKMDCAMEKMKHSAKNLSDKIETNSTEVKKKVD